MKINNVWELVDKPGIGVDKQRPNIIDSKWVFKKKLESDGSIRFKARLVTRGFKDKNQYNLKETYSAVSRLATVRAILAIINKYNLEVIQMDVKTAFLNREIEKEIYMKIPEGLKIEESVRLTKVCKLEKALYGVSFF